MYCLTDGQQCLLSNRLCGQHTVNSCATYHYSQAFQKQLIGRLSLNLSMILQIVLKFKDRQSK